MLQYAFFFTGRQPRNQQHVTQPAPAAQQFSPVEIGLYKRRMEEGYDLPDPRYRLWLESVTAGSSSVTASTRHPAANDISPPSPADLESACQPGECRHPEGKEVGSVRLLSAVVPLSLCRDSTHNRHRQEVKVPFLHPSLTTFSQSTVVGHTHDFSSHCHHFDQTIPLRMFC